MAKRKFEIDPADQADSKPQHNYKCQAGGCPLAHSITKEGYQLCRYHMGAYAHDWPAITERIKENLYQVMHLNKLRRGSYVEAQLKPNEYYFAFGNPALNLVKGESHREYEARFAKYVWDVVRGGMEPIKLEPEKAKQPRPNVMTKRISSDQFKQAAGAN